jgi:hypothetical protein
MGATFDCDFCGAQSVVDLLRGKGKQELVFPSALVMSGKTQKIAPRLKFRCDDCINKGVNTTDQGLMIHSAKKISKADNK